MSAAGWKMVPVLALPQQLVAAVKERNGEACYKVYTTDGLLQMEGEAALEYTAMLAAAPAFEVTDAQCIQARRVFWNTLATTDADGVEAMRAALQDFLKAAGDGV